VKRPVSSFRHITGQIEAIWSLLGTLSVKQRTIFLLHFAEKIDSCEIEEATGITKAAVHAIRKRLGESK
jgi:hypothetical protein